MDPQLQVLIGLLSIAITILIGIIGGIWTIKRMTETFTKAVGKATETISKEVGKAVEAIHADIKHSQEKLEKKIKG